LLNDGGPDENWTPVGFWADAEQLYLDFSYTGGTSGGYEIRMPLPHINVLILKHDRVTNAVISWQDGRIIFEGHTAPSQQNPSGLRNWEWSTKGYAITNNTQDQGTMFGLAVTLMKPLDYYFEDQPYEDTNQNGWLDPLSIEDPDGPLPKVQWDTDGELSPFDIDNDGYVELPIATDPNTVSGIISSNEKDDQVVPWPYTRSRVLRHTATHEMAHALAGGSHTADPLCLMYEISNNWKRDDHLSDHYRSLLKVHNILR
jgi:hypothetical protein